MFVSGVARSGTSALVSVLNSHPNIFIEMERYYYLMDSEKISREHFLKERFIDVRQGDTFNNGFASTMEQRLARFDEATFVGDKFPLLYKHFDYIFKEFPEALHVYIVRNPLSVMESYDARFKDNNDNWSKDWAASLVEWNDSVTRAARLTSAQRQRFVFLEYEKFFSSTKEMNKPFDFLGVSRLSDEKATPFLEEFRSLNEVLAPRRDDIRSYVSRNACWAEYQAVLKFCDEAT